METAVYWHRGAEHLQAAEDQVNSNYKQGEPKWTLSALLRVQLVSLTI